MDSVRRCGSKLVSGYGVLMYSSYFPKSGYAVLIPVLMYSSYFPKIRLCGTHLWYILGTHPCTHLWYSSPVPVLYLALSAAGEKIWVLCSGTLIRYLEIVRYSSLVLYSGTLPGYSTSGIRYSSRVLLGTFQPAAGEKNLGTFTVPVLKYWSSGPDSVLYWSSGPDYCTHPSGTKVVGPTVMLAVMVYSCTHPISPKAVMLAVMVYSCTHPIFQKAVMLFTMFEPQRCESAVQEYSNTHQKCLKNAPKNQTLQINNQQIELQNNDSTQRIITDHLSISWTIEHRVLYGYLFTRDCHHSSFSGLRWTSNSMSCSNSLIRGYSDA